MHGPNGPAHQWCMPEQHTLTHRQTPCNDGGSAMRLRPSAQAPQHAHNLQPTACRLIGGDYQGDFESHGHHTLNAGVQGLQQIANNMLHVLVYTCRHAECHDTYESAYVKHGNACTKHLTPRQAKARQNHTVRNGIHLYTRRQAIKKAAWIVRLLSRGCACTLWHSL